MIKRILRECEKLPECRLVNKRLEALIMRGREWTKLWKETMAPSPVDEKLIRKCEAKLGADFPSAFRERMLQANGGLARTGSFYWFIFPFPDKSHVLPHPVMWLGRALKDIVAFHKAASEFEGFPSNAVAFGVRRFHNIPDGVLCFLRSEDNPKRLLPQVWLWLWIGKPFKMLLHDASQLWIDNPFKKPKPKQNWKLKPLKGEGNTEYEKFLKTRRKKLHGDERIESDWVGAGSFELIGERLEICDCLAMPDEDTDGFRLGAGIYDLSLKVMTDRLERRISRIRVVSQGRQHKVAEAIRQVEVDGGGVSIFDVDPILGCDPEVLMDLEDRIIGTTFNGFAIFYSFGPTRVSMIQSGYGDGSYPVYALRDGEELVGLEVEFINPQVFSKG
jgi:hypothetical protein